MLTILGENSGSFCDGHSRRDFLQIGGLALGGASLPQLLQAESSLGKPSRGINHKAVIMVMLPGGPPHQDMWDLKMDAPSEYRGEFRPIKNKRARRRDLRRISAHRKDGRQIFVRSIHGRM